MKRSLSSRIPYRFLAAALGMAAFCVGGQAAEADATGVQTLQVRPNFYMIAGAGGNIGVQIGEDGIVLVNAGNGTMTPQVLAELKKLSPLPIRYIIDTDAGPEFVGGNADLSAAGVTIFTNALGRGNLADAAPIMAHDSVLQRMTARKGNTDETLYPGQAWPTEAFFQNRRAIRMNGEGIEIFYQPAAHSNADSFVLFRSSDVVVAGDVIDTRHFPVIDLEHGGSIQGEIAALNRLIELTIAPIPYIYKGAGTYVIPGHGYICEQNEIVDYRDMVATVKDVVADMMERGMTLDQIQAARPALPYETRYGAETGPWTTKMFIEAIYTGLQSGKK